MKKRHLARAAAFQILYQQDILGSKDEISEKNLDAHFDSFHISPDVREFARRLVRGALQKTSECDTWIEKFAQNWKITRLAVVDRAILRLSIYEMLYEPETAHPIIIDEALELAEQFSSEQTSAFINGILDSISKEIGKK